MFKPVEMLNGSSSVRASGDLNNGWFARSVSNVIRVCNFFSHRFAIEKNINI